MTGRRNARGPLLMGGGRLRCVRKALVSLAASVYPVLAFALDPVALPTGGTIAAGAASISQAGARLNVEQQSNRAILNWSTFNIGANAAVNFRQPASNSVVLNRVSGGGGVSEIYGSLTANGQVFLVNPAGTLFGRGAQVNVGALVASSLDITNENFLNGVHRFASNGFAGSILNLGALTAAEGGYIALLAPQVRNEGVVVARMGSVAFGAGEAVRLDINGTGLVEMQVERAAVDALIANRALVQADGGVVLMSARAAGQLAAGVINNGGEIRAARVTERDGVVRLEAGDVTNSGRIAADGASGGRVTLVSDGTTVHSGSITARGSDGRGGEVRLLGDKVGLFGAGQVDASGQAGGGTVLVGGNYQGKGPERNASMSYVGPNASIRADAGIGGDGGKVVVWSDDSTVFAGILTAKGGASTGNGGFAEVSGKNSLAFSPRLVDLKATGGQPGRLLLDPLDIIVATSGGASYGDVSTFAAQNGTTQTIDPTVLNSLGATVDLQAVNNITVTNPINLTTASAGLNAKAGNNINVNASITTNGGAISLSARDSGGSQTMGGTVMLAGSLSSTGGTISVTNNGGLNPISIGAPVNAGAGTVTFSDKAVLAISATVTGSATTFSGAVDAATTGLQSLSVSGNATFGGVVGGGTALGALSVSGSTTINAGAIATSNAGGGTGSQTYTGAVTLGTASGTTVALTNTGGSVAFGSTVNASTSGQQALSVSGNASFGGVVGGVTALRALSVGGTSALNSTSIATTNAGGGTGSQTYTGAVTLGAASGATVALTNTGGTVAFGSTVNASSSGQQALSVSNDASFGGVVGGAAALRAFSVGGKSALNTSSIATTNAGGGTGSQTYTGAVTLGTAVTLSSGTGNVTFSGTVNGTSAGSQSLTINSTGATLFGAAVGGTTSLASLTTDSGGTTSVLSVTTTGAQSYNDNLTTNGTYTTTNSSFSTAGTTTLAGATTVTAGSGNVTFGGTLNGAQALTVNTTGSTAFSGEVGGTTALASLATNAGGTTTVYGGAIRTSGAQSYGDDVTLDGNSTSLVASGTSGTITISGLMSSGSGAINLTAGGAIIESGSGRISTSGTLTTSSGTGQTLTGANTVTTFNATNSSGDLGFTNTASALSITGINSTGTGNVTVNNTGVMSITGPVNAIGSGSNVSLTSSGQMSESGSGVVNAAGTLTTSSVGGLSMNGANTVGGFSATNTTSGNIAFTNTANGANSAPTVAGVTALTVGSITQSGGGGITIANTGNLSTSGSISSSGGSISLTSTNGSQTIGGSGMNAGAGGITLSATGSAGDITLNSTLNMGSFTADAGRDIVRNAGFATSTGGFSATAGRDIRILASGTTAAMTASTMTLSAGGDLKIQGGTGSGALAYAYSNGTGASQTISANTINIEGGSIGNGNYAGIFGRGPQSITAPAGITLKGGPSGGVSGAGNFAEISTTGNQTLTVGSGNLTAIGGGGGATNTDNYARIYQYDAAGTQTINVNHGGSIVLTGGSSGLSNVGGTGHGSRASIDTTGTSQSINFAAGGAINLTGGTAGSRAFALITSENGSQTITGSPTITLTGGASGGVDGEGNYAEIFAKTSQTINASSILLTGGGAGIENGAGIVSDASQAITSGSMTLNAGAGGTKNAAYVQARTQNITVHGNLSLNGGGSASSATNGGGAGLGGRGAPNASPTDLLLSVDGNLTMAGGGSGAAIGSGFIGGQTTDMTINVGGNVTLDPGAAGVRIGTPSSNPAGGNISITAGGTLALNDAATAGTSILTAGGTLAPNDTATAGSGIRTLGNVTLKAASISGGTNGRSLIAANTLTSTSLSGATQFNTLVVNSLSATSSGALNLGQGVVNGALVAVSNGNPITQVGPLMVAGTASITAGAAPITLTAANDFQGVVTLSNSGANAAQISDINTITFSNMVLGGALTVNAPTIISHDTTTTGNQLWNGSVTFNSTETTNGGNFTVAGTTTVGSGLTVNAGTGNVTFQGAVTGSQPLVVNTSGATTFASTVSPTVVVTLTGGTSAVTATTQAVSQTVASVVASTTGSLSTEAVSTSPISTSTSTSNSTTSAGAAAATVAAAAGPPPPPLTAATSTEAGTTRLTASSGVSKETIRQIDQQISQARTQMFSPALAQLSRDPSAADVPECGAGGGTVCVKQGKPKKSATLAPDAEPVIKRRLAVLFGNDRYLAPIPALQTPGHDVDEIGKVLKDRLGYEVRVVKNASKEAIVNELNNLVTDVEEDDSVFVYYAGHGYQADKGGGGYWIPVDANNSDASSWISNSAISKFLANMAARQVMLVSDSCYSGTLAQEQKVSATESTVFDRKEILRKRSVLVMSSGGNEPVSDGGHEDHSLFAYHLLRNLKNIDADLVGSDIHARVYAAVTKEYPQDPQYGAVVSAGHAEGGEYLIMKK